MPRAWLEGRALRPAAHDWGRYLCYATMIGVAVGTILGVPRSL